MLPELVRRARSAALVVAEYVGNGAYGLGHQSLLRSGALPLERLRWLPGDDLVPYPYGRRPRPSSSAAVDPPAAQPRSPEGAGVVTGLPLGLLRSEGVALLAMAAILYGRSGRSWWLFLALLPAPDLGLLGNLRSRRVGAVAYDLTHTYVFPAALGVVGVLGTSGLAVTLALVWFAHIGMDRTLGLGLQYPDGSGRTHLREARRTRNQPDPGGGAWTG